MKKYLNKKNIILTILILIILTGVVMLFLKGFNKGVEYKAGTRIEVYIPNGYEKQDILNIANESFETNLISFSKVEKLNQIAGIKLSKYSEEELSTFKAKIAERYEMEEESIELYEISIPETRIRTIMTPYLLPVLLTTILSLVFVGIKNYKAKGKFAKLLNIISKLVITLGVYFSIILIFRIPFVIYTMPIALLIYIITLLIVVDKE